ncbi:MAG: succinate dehydrogenase cytochrome b subunit [Acidobacteriaceae bacterium]|jgi:succinate dehydrogenase / fumarate reductase cytochrome b subunit|nr:succinate dehydrogenase cytochrome b subunit [Acidobacteriaceae bacterium]
MSSRIRFLESSVGTKILIGLTGLFLFIYLLVHIAGNLAVLAGPDTFNRYSAALVNNPAIAVIEVVLVLGILTHIFKALTMYLANRQARPVGYTMKRPAGHTSRKSLASSTMILSGLWLLTFIVIHVRAFKFGPAYERDGIHDLYRVEFENLSNPLTVTFYVITMLIVGSHLWHGIASSFQSLGLNHPRWTPRLRVFGKVMAVVIAGGFAAIVVWVFVSQTGQVVR